MNQINNDGSSLLIGTDEVGRGPLVGPVVSASVSLIGKNKISMKDSLKELESLVPNLTDSKKLSSEDRKFILDNLGIHYSKLRPGNVYQIDQINKNFSFCISKVGHKVIDRINILQASLKSMRDSIKPILNLNPDHSGIILIDGNKFINLKDNNFQEIPIIKGDSKSYLIGLASIIAKEYRDNLMKNYGKKYPGYGFETNSGYPTAKHKEALRVQGITPWHRKTFKGVRELFQSDI